MAASDRLLIRVYGDSLSLPRTDEKLEYHQTYAELLATRWRQCLPGTSVYLYNRSFTGANASSIYETYRSDTFFFGRPGGDIGIIQCGVVDCAPRPIAGWARDILSRAPDQIRNSIVRLLHNYRASILTSGFVWQTVPPPSFAKFFAKLLALAAPDFPRLYVLNIAPTNSETESHSPGFSASIDLYNSLIAKTIKATTFQNITLIDVHKAIATASNGIERYISHLDGHHITPDAHRLYADLICDQEKKFGLTEAETSTVSEGAA